MKKWFKRVTRIRRGGEMKDEMLKECLSVSRSNPHMRGTIELFGRNEDHLLETLLSGDLVGAERDAILETINNMRSMLEQMESFLTDD